MNILVTGGGGFIGSHTCVALVTAGINPIIVDNFANSSKVVIERLFQIVGQDVVYETGNVIDTAWVIQLLKRHKIAGVLHFAGDKAVGESVASPLKYYANNVGSAISLLAAMHATGCNTLVFSSSATVYGDAATVPIAETAPRSHTNPYGHTKLIIEDILAAQRIANPALRAGILRYFNPVGAHPSGLIGEDPRGTPNNLMPYIAQVAAGKRPYLNVYGNDYATPDGTGLRDYIHVQDLAQGHVAALQALLRHGESFTVNMGTSRGHSVLDVVHAFEKASGMPVPYKIVARRPGDVAQCYADASLAQRLLGWSANKTLAEMCADAWRWQCQNPNGYE